MSEIFEAYDIGYDIVDDRKADFSLQKMQEADEDCDRWIEFYKDQIEKVKRERDRIKEGYMIKLRAFFAERQAMNLTKGTKSGKSSSYQLPHGKLILKQQDPEFEIDNDALVEWLEKNDPGMVKIKKAPNWEGLKKKVEVAGDGVVNQEGELIPGVKVTSREEKFAVQMKGVTE